MSCVYHGRTKGEGYGHVKSIVVPLPSISVIVCHCMSFARICPGKNFILDSSLANFWERNYPFGFLLGVLIVMPLLLVRSSFPLVSWTEDIR